MTMLRVTLLFAAVGVANVLGYNVTNHLEFSHQWLHQDMLPEELASHFGLLDPNDVDFESYRVITVKNIFQSEGENQSN